jgi:TPR repeat protein
MTDDEIEHQAYEAMKCEDFALAERLFKSLEDGESDYALTSLGWMHENGCLGATNKKLATTYYERAMAIGSENAHLQMALLLANDSRLPESLEAINRGMETAIDNRDLVDKLRNLKSLVLDHLACQNIERKEYEGALKILQSQIPPESEYTLSLLGWLYHTGVAGVKNNNLSRTYYRRAGELGSIDANFQIGMVELSEDNDEAARAAFQEGAQLQHFPSISKLASMMIEGQGGHLDVKEGILLLMRCAEQGHILSKVRLLKIEINEEKNVLIRLMIRLKYVSILIELMNEVIRGSKPSNYFEFR